ncbi:MAG: lipid-A-disaccharide synthase [Candidatus Kapabacteria bacterium]|nr:lipid-A-disaccharide synthase [Candidatus Kapabacteria bacterium]
MKRYFIIAGDPSGDSHGALLIREIRKIEPQSRFYGIGGSAMLAEGFDSIIPQSSVSVVGFWEVLKKYSFFKNLLNRCQAILRNDKPDAFIPIDYPGFNIRMAKYAKSINIPVIYYIAPQLWAWGKDRAKQLVGNVDKLLTVFPFETEFFARFSINTDFVGHPLLDNPDFENISQLERDYKLAFFPGSREQEVVKHLNLFTKILQETGIQNEFPISVAKAKNVPNTVYDSFASNFQNINFENDSANLLRTAKAGFIKTGTSNLEACLAELPFAMYYKTSFLSYIIAKKLVNLEHISIVNILTKRNTIREFVQNDIEPKTVAKHLRQLMTDDVKRKVMIEEFREIRQYLGGLGASHRAAKIISEFR